MENSLHEEIGQSRNPSEKNKKSRERSPRKRQQSETDISSTEPKRQCMNVNIVKDEDSRSASALQDNTNQDFPGELQNACQTSRHGSSFHHQLIELAYQVDLSILCLLRKSMYEHKYPSLSLAFGASGIDKFSNIVLCFKEKSIHIQTKNVDKYYVDDISYARLFTREKGTQSFFVNSYFDSFVKHLISESKLDSSLDDIEYLVMYTNSGLSLAEEKKLKKGRSRNFYPFKFDSINMEECDILKDFLFTDDVDGRSFYRFSKDRTTRKELFKQLVFLSVVLKVMKERTFSWIRR